MDSPMSTRLPLLKLPILVVLLALSGLLLAGAAHAAQPVPGTTPLAFEEEFVAEEEGEEGEGEVEGEESACEEAEEEFDEGELSGADVKEICDEEAAERRKKPSGLGAPAPEECILRSAHAHASLISHGEKLKLTLGYTTYEPVTAKLEIGHLGTIHRHLGRSGVLRQVENLHGDNPPKQLNVQIGVPGSPGFCGKYLAQKIKVH
jgi:hypothetical protein